MNKKMIETLESRKTDLIAKATTSEDFAELKSIYSQIDTINKDLTALRSAQAEYEAIRIKNNPTDEELIEERRRTLDNPNAPIVGRSADYIQGKGFIPAENRGSVMYDSEFEKREQAGNELKKNNEVKSPFSVFGELRAVTVTPASGQTASIIVPSNFSSNINPDFPVVSSLIDSVSHLSLPDGKSFSQAYITGIDAGNYTAEGANAINAETHFAYVDINQTKVTAYAEITEELEKLPSAPYADVVFQNIRTSIRKLITKEILVGAGGNNQLVGIFSNLATAIDPATDLSLSDIDDKTLDRIVFSYGGDEEVEDPAVLILNKKDLMKFAEVRTNTKQKFYDIRIAGNSGTINSVPFIINSACKQLTATSGTSAGDYCMAYGSLSNYQLVEFSPMEVSKSNDYKFPQGMKAFRGVAWYGGNVVRKNGFLRVKKAAS